MKFLKPSLMTLIIYWINDSRDSIKQALEMDVPYNCKQCKDEVPILWDSKEDNRSHCLICEYTYRAKHGHGGVASDKDDSWVSALRVRILYGKVARNRERRHHKGVCRIF